MDKSWSIAQAWLLKRLLGYLRDMTRRASGSADAGFAELKQLVRVQPKKRGLVRLPSCPAEEACGSDDSDSDPHFGGSYLASPPPEPIGAGCGASPVADSSEATAGAEHQSAAMAHEAALEDTPPAQALQEPLAWKCPDGSHATAGPDPNTTDELKDTPTAHALQESSLREGPRGL